MWKIRFFHQKDSVLSSVGSFIRKIQFFHLSVLSSERYVSFIRMIQFFHQKDSVLSSERFGSFIRTIWFFHQNHDHSVIFRTLFVNIWIFNQSYSYLLSFTDFISSTIWSSNSYITTTHNFQKTFCNFIFQKLF